MEIFKGVISYIIDYHVKRFGAKPRIEYDANLELSLNVMRLLFTANTQSQKVPYSVFTIPELTENIDLRSDYVSWLMDKSVSGKKIDWRKVNRISLTKIVVVPADELLPLQLSVLIRCQSENIAAGNGSIHSNGNGNAQRSSQFRDQLSTSSECRCVTVCSVACFSFKFGPGHHQGDPTVQQGRSQETIESQIPWRGS